MPGHSAGSQGFYEQKAKPNKIKQQSKIKPTKLCSPKAEIPDGQGDNQQAKKYLRHSQIRTSI